MTENHLVSLIARHWSGELSEEEAAELREWTNADSKNRLFLEGITNEGHLENELERWRSVDLESAYSKLKEVIHIRRMSKVRRLAGWSVAAAVLIAIAIIGVSRKGSRDLRPAVVAASPVQQVMPGRSTATLTLSNGHVILLDSMNRGNVGVEGGARLEKKDSSSISYTAASESKENETVAYNTLTTPRSGQYQLTLPDGSHVWLNNISSLRYPTIFKGKNRTVELTGEGYFEIAKDVTRPFYVKVKGQVVEVLGTSFNIMAYSEEGSIQTTLLSGTVVVKASVGGATLKLRQDEQAQLSDNGKLTLIKNVPSEDIVSWKNGFFYFGRASFAEVMRQLARWYDVDVIYKGKVPEIEFGGKIDRGLPLNELLKFLDKNQIHFRLEGRDLIVLPS